MSNLIFNIPSWSANTSYRKNDIIIDNTSTYYYYAALNHTSSASFATDLAAGDWVGTIVNNNETKPYFTWKSSYKYSNENVPRVKKIQFGDGYQQSIRDGINNLLLKLTLPFENRDIAEYTAIIHFLYTRAGAESFVMLAPAPYGILKRFRCASWSDTQAFYNNYSIQAVFEESVV